MPHTPSSQSRRDSLAILTARRALRRLARWRADDRNEWITTGMACHSVSHSLLEDWTEWSRQSPKFREGECERLWNGFRKRGDGYGLGTLIFNAKRDSGQSIRGGTRCETAVHGENSVVRFTLDVYPDMRTRARRYADAISPQRLKAVARQLGVSQQSLRRLGIGWDGAALTFPMKDAAGRVVGIRRRFLRGRKSAVRGSKQGLFIPRRLALDEMVLIAEGPTDTAALLDLGFDAVGRPSAHAGHDLCIEWLGECGVRCAVCVADNDDAGVKAAEALATQCAIYCERVKVLRPPGRYKDAREWIVGGATRCDIEARIREALLIKVCWTRSTK